MQHAAVVQHRQVEAAAVPRHDLRREFLDAVEEALDDRAFIEFRRRQRPDAKTVKRAQHAGNGDDTLQVQRQEIAAVLGPALLEGQLGDFGVRQFARQLVDPAQAGDIGNGLDVEYENRFHAAPFMLETRRSTGSGRRGRRQC
jgi:hypothetical protein